MQCGDEMAMQQFVHCAQPAAAGAVQASELMELTNRIDGNTCRIDKKQKRGCGDSSDGGNGEEDAFRPDIHGILQPVNPVSVIQHADGAENDEHYNR